NPPSLASRWSTPTPTHAGDLVIDANLLISSGGGPGIDAANGDYWFNYARWSSYYALGFYNTAYDSPSVTDKTIVSQKILSSQGNLLAEADELALEGKDSSDATAAKYYWTVLQGPSLDAGLTERAKTGLPSALGKLLTEADKLALDGTGPSLTNAVQDYLIVLQGPNLDANSAARAKTGLLSAYSKLQTPKFSALVRIAGSDRVDTSVQQALAGWTQGASTVVLARSDDFPDALAGVPLAAQLDAPILLTPPQGLDSRVQDALKVLHPGKIYLLGGEGALSAKVSAELKTLGWDSGKQIRLSGADRYATAAIISQSITGVQNPAVAIATGENFPDALSIASFAGQKKMPVLLTSKNKVPQKTLDALKQMRPSKVYLIGGEGVISSLVAQGLCSSLNLPASSVIRLSGATRYETMAAVGEAFEGDIKALSFATGEDFPNALTGAALAVHQNQTLILLPGTSVESHPKLKELITRHLSQSATQPYLSGSVEAIPQGLEDELNNILGQRTCFAR
ncbi:MAG TPA: cell wall-binding repeat-containing protein, partial [Desulfosporosinus sp.]|nr:cell wall-binding repeat-containing protein [Desulfosporosinus sp.]